jgi:hypothetical protein
MMKKCTAIIASAVLATVLVSGAAISQLADDRAFPTDRTHATPAMIEAYPDLF